MGEAQRAGDVGLGVEGVEAYDAVVEVEPHAEVSGGGEFVEFVGYHDAAQVMRAGDSNGGEDLLAGSSSASFSGGGHRRVWGTPSGVRFGMDALYGDSGLAVRRGTL